MYHKSMILTKIKKDKTMNKEDRGVYHENIPG